MRFSIIMPVLNEEAVLEQHLAHLTHQCAPYDYELLIVDGGSHDNTVTIARQYGQIICSPRGRAIQMNTGASMASGDVLIFLHADTQLPDDAFSAIERALTSPAVVGGAFCLRFDNNLWSYKCIACLANLRSRLRLIFTGDQAYFVRSTSFQAIGGYPVQPLMEDREIIINLQKVGTVVLLPQYVTTSARRHQKIGVLRSVLFMGYIRILYRFGVSPARLHRMYMDVR
ncbi:MAG TPA: TIGR04283 family arsenosugar biosynthesis glycosyltransferase [Ktedonobacteraceae bacterium]|nr:TIGR04283 family arsenosugar biosynthesis glycosyltransferase [Ktedonobacteraceae bacterium]